MAALTDPASDGRDVGVYEQFLVYKETGSAGILITTAINILKKDFHCRMALNDYFHDKFSLRCARHDVAVRVVEYLKKQQLIPGFLEDGVFPMMKKGKKEL